MTRIVPVVALSLVLVSCATILAPGPDFVPVDSEPVGARVYLDNRPVGATPTIVAINRKDAGILRLEAPGYEPLVLDLDKEFNPPTVLNVFFLAGFVVDVATEDIGRYPEVPVFVRLVARYDDGREVTVDRPLEIAQAP